MSNSESQEKQLLELDRKWSEAASEGKDLDAILSFWTDDAVVMPPGQPSVKGKEALRQYLEASFEIPGFRISWESDRAEISADGTMAHVFSTNRVAMNDPNGNPLEFVGRAITIWRRDEGGEWRCSVDIWNAEGQ